MLATAKIVEEEFRDWLQEWRGYSFTPTPTLADALAEWLAYDMPYHLAGDYAYFLGSVLWIIECWRADPTQYVFAAEGGLEQLLGFGVQLPQWSFLEEDYFRSMVYQFQYRDVRQQSRYAAPSVQTETPT